MGRGQRFGAVWDRKRGKSAEIKGLETEKTGFKSRCHNFFGGKHSILALRENLQKIMEAEIPRVGLKSDAVLVYNLFRAP